MSWTVCGTLLEPASETYCIVGPTLRQPAFPSPFRFQSISRKENFLGTWVRKMLHFTQVS
jgi:hypothetical protein